MDRFDYCIIGAGAIGLAIAHKLSQASPHANILLIEYHSQFGSETSSRNSEVIHAGIYYPHNSLKANLCLQGKEQLYDFCKTYSVPHKKIGKLIVASSPDQLSALETLQTKAKKNGVLLKFLDEKECCSIEPHVKAVGALYSASTGIIDSHAYMHTLLTLAEQQGVLYSPNTQFIRAKKIAQGFQLELNTADGEFNISCDNLINSAGLFAPVVAEGIEPLERSFIPAYHFCRGHYFSYQRQSPFSHLIYPLPNKNTSGLGIHATLDLSGQVRFGPDTQYIDQIDYAFPDQQAALKVRFSQAIQKYFPKLDQQKLQPSYSGIRPKLSAEHEAAQDFLIQDQTAHKVEGLVNLFGIESPGLTSSLAIADSVVGRFKDGY